MLLMIHVEYKVNYTRRILMEVLRNEDKKIHNIEVILENIDIDPTFITCICGKKFFKVININGKIEEEIVCSRCGRIVRIHIHNQK